MRLRGRDVEQRRGLNLIYVKRKKSGRADVGCKVDGGWEAARDPAFFCCCCFLPLPNLGMQVQGWYGKCRGQARGCAGTQVLWH